MHGAGLSYPGSTGARARPRIRGAWVGGGAILVTLLVVTLLAVLSGPNLVIGTPRALEAKQLSRSALATLGSIEDLRLQGTIATDTGVELSVVIVALATGETTATVVDRAGGRAELLAVDDRVVINADQAWWLNTIPVFAQHLSGTWIQATEDMGFPIGMLTTLSAEELRRKIADSVRTDHWSAEAVERPDGTPALALTTRDSPWTVYVAARGEPRLLGIDGPLAAGGDRLRRASQGGSYPTASVSTAEADDPCAQRAREKIGDATEQVRTAPAPPPMPTPRRGPQASISLPPTPLCTSPVCPVPVMVSNPGTEPAVGTVSVTVSSGGGGLQPFSVPAGGQAQLTFTAGNPATGCTRTCTRTAQVQAFAQITSIAGPDIEQGKRLHNNGIDPNGPIPDQPAIAGPQVNTVADGLTRAPAVSGFTAGAGQPAVDVVLDLIKKSRDGRFTSILFHLIPHLDRLATPGGGTHPVIDVAERVTTGTDDEKLAALQTLQLMLDLAALPGRPPATLRIEQGLLIDVHNRQVYSVGALKTATPATLSQKVYDLVDQTLDRFTNAPGDTAGFGRIPVLEFGHAVPKFGSTSRANLMKRLNLANGDQAVRDLFLDGSAALMVTRLMVANQATVDRAPLHRYVYDAEDLRAFAHQRDLQPPSTRPTSRDLNYSPDNERHIMVGDPDDPAATQHSKAGGHKSGAGGPQRTEFPRALSADDIKAAIGQVVDQGNTVDLNDQPSNAANNSYTQYGTPVWSWRYVGTATVNGVTVELEVIVYPDGSVRTAFPTAGPGSGNTVVTREDVHVNRTATITDSTIFKNPDEPPANPQLNGARTGAPGTTRRPTPGTTRRSTPGETRSWTPRAHRSSIGPT